MASRKLSHLAQNRARPRLLAAERLESRKLCALTDFALVSSTASGERNASHVYDPVVSGNGRYVAFVTTASLSPDDTNPRADVYWKDTQTGAISLVSRGLDDIPNEPAWGESGSPAISDDGRFVLFLSSVGNLVANDELAVYADLFRKDMQTGEIRLVSTTSSGRQISDGVDHGVISGDGNFIAFTCPDDIDGFQDQQLGVFVKNLTTGVVVAAGTSAAGVAADAEARNPSLSRDGRWVAFQSPAGNLTPGDNNDELDVFVKDLQTGAIERVSQLPNGDSGEDGSDYPRISADGNLVLFHSFAHNFATARSPVSYLFLKNRATGVMTQVTRPEDGAFYGHSLSADGRRVAYFASDIEIGVYDVATGQNTIVNTSQVQGTFSHHMYRTSLSVDGTKVVFDTHHDFVARPNPNHVVSVYSATVLDGSFTWSLSFSATTISENRGGATGTVNRGPGFPLSQPVTITLTNSSPTRVTAPSSVVIPANQLSATFTVRALDNAFTDGAVTVTIGAAVTDWQGSATLTVRDNELTAAWHNATPGLRSDVDGNGDVDAQDVLWPIWFLSQFPDGDLPFPPPPQIPLMKVEISGDGHFDVQDLLYAQYDYVARQAGGESEGESSTPDAADLAWLMFVPADGKRKNNGASR